MVPTGGIGLDIEERAPKSKLDACQPYIMSYNISLYGIMSIQTSDSGGAYERALAIV